MSATSPRISYTIREGSTSEDERLVLANVYSIVLASHESKKAAGANGGRDATKGSRDGRADSSIYRT